MVYFHVSYDNFSSILLAAAWTSYVVNIHVGLYAIGDRKVFNSSTCNILHANAEEQNLKTKPWSASLVLKV